MSLHKLTAGDGYEYLTKQVAANDSTVDGGSALADYYSAKGESPGVWLGSGLACLEDGPSAGDQVSAAQMKALFGEGRHPDADRIEAAAIAEGVSVKDAMAATKLGKQFLVYSGESDFRKRVAEAFAEYNTARGESYSARIGEDERAEIRTRVAREMFLAEYGREPLTDRELSGFVAKGSRQKTTAVAGYDTTFSPVKSVSTLWSIAPREVSEKIEAAHDAAVRKAIDYLERNACLTRVGTAGVAQIDADGLLATAFTHRDSRAGDPDLHTHVAISNKVRATMPDGTSRWLALDGRMIHKLAVSASETYNTALESELRTRLGVRFADRDSAENGKRTVRDVVGVDPRLNEVFSSRRAQIEARRGELAAAFQRDHGREPTPTEAIALAQQANLETRQAKHEPRSHAEQRAAWRATALHVLGGEQELSDMVRAATHPRRAAYRTKVNDAWIADAADRLIDTVSQGRARWQRAHVVAEAQRIVRAANLSQRLVDRTADRLVDAALAPDKTVALGVRDEPANTPEALRRRDGESVYVTSGAQVYTCESVLAAEERIVTAAERTDGRIAGEMDVELALLEQAANRVKLNSGQAALVREMATSGARVQLALAPAGTGKTTAMAALARAWENSGGTVLGLAPTAAAAAALRDDLGASTDTMGKLLDVLAREQPEPGWVTRIGPETLVVVDEAGMASTADLDRVITFVLDRGGSVRLVGDDQQLASVAAGGVLRDIDAACGAVALSHVVRFTDPAEGAASLGLRDGDPAAIGFYIDHGRVHVSDRVAAEDAAYRAWQADRDRGLDAVMLAPTRELVRGLNERARTDRLAALTVKEDDAPRREVLLGDELAASVGDVICTRRNDRRLMLTATDFVRNGDRWIVREVHDDGSITATRLGDAARTISLPAEYVREHVTLGYARTIHGAQGVTADTCHTIATGTEDRQLAYVALTRGRQANHLYLGTAGDGDPETSIHRDTLLPPTAVDTFAAILARDGAQKSATTTARELADPAPRLAAAAGAYDDAVGAAAEHLLGEQALARIDAAADDIVTGLTEMPAYPVLRKHLATLALGGDDPVEILRSAAQSRELKTAADVAAVLDWRLDHTGNHSAGRGPLPWLPAIPATLADDETWGAYLTARRELVTDLADRVRDRAQQWTSGDAPRWALPLIGADDPSLIADLAVFRAAFEVDDADRRPTGPDRYAAAQRRHQQHLKGLAAAIFGDTEAAAGRWQPLAEELEPRLLTDPFWPELADRFTLARRAGVDVPALARRAAADRPLPDELPAAALWWRLSAELAPAAADRAEGSALHPVWEADLVAAVGADAAAAIVTDPAWPLLVAAVESANPAHWTPGTLLDLAAELLHTGSDDEPTVRPDQYTTALTWRIEAALHHSPTVGTDEIREEPVHPDEDEAAAAAAGVPDPEGGAPPATDVAVRSDEYYPPLTDDDLPSDPELPLEPGDEYPIPDDAHLAVADPESSAFAEEGDTWVNELLAESRAAKTHSRYANLPPIERVAQVHADLAVARDRFDRLWRAMLDHTGEHLTAAFPQIADIQARADAQRPYAADDAYAHRRWIDAAVAAEIAAAESTRLARAVETAEDDDTAAALAADHALAVHVADHTAAEAAAAHADYLAAHDKLVEFAGGTANIVTSDHALRVRLLAEDLDGEVLAAARRDVDKLQGELLRAESAAARHHADTATAPPRTPRTTETPRGGAPGGAVATLAPPTTVAEQIADYNTQIRAAYDERARALIGALLPETNLHSVTSSDGWDHVVREIARTDTARLDTDTITAEAVHALSRAGQAKTFDRERNTPALVLARELAAARSQRPALPTRADELRHLGLPTPPPGTALDAAPARLAAAIEAEIRDALGTAENTRPAWFTALGDPGADPRREELRREVAAGIVAHRLAAGIASDEPNPLAGIAEDEKLRARIDALGEAEHYRPDYARMSDSELAAARRAARTRLSESGYLLMTAEKDLTALRGRATIGAHDLDREAASVETARHAVRRDEDSLAALDAEQRLRTVSGSPAAPRTIGPRSSSTTPAPGTEAGTPEQHPATGLEL